MKILLVACNAKYIHSNLAVYDLQAYASDYADHIVLKEYTINQQKDDIMRDIYLEHPDVVCVSCYIWNLSFVKELMADLIKILHNDANILALGGRVVGPGLALKIVDTFLNTPFSNDERHIRRINQIETE